MPQTLYADATDLVPEVMSQVAADSFSSAEKTKALTNASADADDELNRRYALPLAQWPGSLRRNVATIAGYELLSGRGFDSADEGSALKTRALAARAWLKRVGDGTLDPPGIVDDTDDDAVHEGGAVVVTDGTRGW